MDDFGTVLRGNFGAGCWCMFPRLTDAQMRELPGEGSVSPRRRVAMTHLAGREPAPGLLAYQDGQPVGWVAVAPRSEFTRVVRSRATPPVDDEPVWVIPCVTVRRTHRGQGHRRGPDTGRRGIRGQIRRTGGGGLPQGGWRTHRRRQRLFRHRADVSPGRVRGRPRTFAEPPAQLAAAGDDAYGYNDRYEIANCLAGEERTVRGLFSGTIAAAVQDGQRGQQMLPVPLCFRGPCR